MLLCAVSPMSWSDDCTRLYLQAFPPFIIAAVLLLCYIPVPQPKAIRERAQAFRSPFQAFLPVSEAECYLSAEDEGDSDPATRQKPSSWRGMFFATLAVCEFLSWAMLAGYGYFLSLLGWLTIQGHSPSIMTSDLDYTVITAALNAVSWIPAIISSLTRPKSTVPFGILVLYLAQSVGAIYRLGSIWFDYEVTGERIDTRNAIWSSIHLLVVLSLVTAVITMPLHVPGNDCIVSKIVNLSHFLSCDADYRDRVHLFRQKTTLPSGNE